MKKIYLLILAVFFALAVKVCAQVPAAYAGAYNRMMANSAMNNAMNMSRMMNQRWYYGFDYLENPAYAFQVKFKNDSVLVVRSKIYADTATHKSYLIYVNRNLKRSDPNREQKIYAYQTVQISRYVPNYFDTRRDFVSGMATDSCWLFKVASGKINIYSHLSGGSDLNNLYLRAFQVGDGPIQKIDSAALVSIIKDNPKAMKAFKKKDYYTAIDRFNSSNK